MEKVAREQYLMKKDDEDVFVVGEGQVMSDEGRVTSNK
jgi:hypothetical protein